MAVTRLLILCSLLLAWDAIDAAGAQNSKAILAPPVGNSLVLKSRTKNGRQIYRCSLGEWLPVGANADLVKASNPSIPVGAYSSLFFQGNSTISATWILSNPAGDAAESGYNSSSVSGKEIATAPSGGFISEALLQATSHQFNGVASLISYVQRLFPQGGNPPLQQTCVQDALILEVPFDAEFWFWQQDLTPPVTPSAMSIHTERVVQGLFGEGVVSYRYNGNSWQQMQAQATLYDLPGGTVTGKYFVQAPPVYGRAGSYWWQASNPNGFQVFGKDQCKPVPVDQNCLAWSLVSVTSYSSPDTSLGAYTHVQMVSTRGGLPPSHLNFVAVTGMLIRAPFSAVFWFYTKS
ncbi:hypothetical protein O6H91_13G002300 [Diphasiastrum complanatum]|uniref:Uncharacterized protein n=1 Tax=Diphasiastrum complanatum TaxID=34168 RepID=A0ACC2BRM6_DIPCM|nr:hypothetical protein O6H91_Y300000 [Diphasiastrum complanatum]KAJ7532401.1 hypothetical protein O6H91_13G002300 [Diphasiastrum complanatum]